MPSSDDVPDAPGIVLLDEIAVRFHELDGRAVADKTVRQRVRILRDDGRSLGDFREFYDTTFEEVLDAYVQVTFPDGETKSYTKDELDDVMASGNALYADGRSLVKNHTALPLGTVVEYVATFRQNRPDLFQFAFYFGVGWGDTGVPTKLARFTVTAPEDWRTIETATHYWRPIELPPTRVDRQAGLRTMVWEQRDIPALAAEPQGAGLADRTPRVATRLVEWTTATGKHTAPESLQALSKFLAELQDGTAEPTPKIRAEVASILAGAPDVPEEKARRLYEWVQEKIRYVAIEIGLGGWRPYTAAEVFDSGYGDCKDKATLLKSMLHVAGIDSHLASLFSHSGHPRSFGLPALGNSNHAILAIDLDGRTLFVDPTERTVPFGELPLRDQEAEILLAKSDGAEVMKTGSSTAEDNTKILQFALELDGADDAIGTFTATTTGAFASDLRYALLAESDKDKKETAEVWLWIARGSVDQLTHTGDPEGSGPMTTTGTVRIPRIVGRSGATRLLRLSDFMGSPGRLLPENDARKTPVVFRKRVRRQLELRLMLPPGLTARQLPEPVKIDATHGSYEVKWSIESGGLVVRSDYRLNRRVVPPSEYETLRQFFYDIRLANQRGVLIKPEAS